MKLFFSAVAAAALVAPLLASAKCKSDGCYDDWMGPPNCVEGQPCPAIAYRARVCPWTCGEAVPENCLERCKPCKAEVCLEICECEKACMVEA